MKKENNIFHFVFFIIVTIELLSRWLGNDQLEYLSKPLILIWIAVFYYFRVEKGKMQKSVLFAFAFSWIGDILLMFADYREVLFFAGIGGFFIAQIFYIITFLGSVKGMRNGYLYKRPVLILPFVVYFVFMMWYLLQGIAGIMQVFILAYGLSLLGLALSALNRYNEVSVRGFRLVFTGAIFFLLSDTLIAVDKFQYELPKASFIIMLTYILAQFLILKGILNDNEKVKR